MLYNFSDLPEIMPLAHRSVHLERAFASHITHVICSRTSLDNFELFLQRDNGPTFYSFLHSYCWHTPNRCIPHFACTPKGPLHLYLHLILKNNTRTSCVGHGNHHHYHHHHPRSHHSLHCCWYFATSRIKSASARIPL